MQPVSLDISFFYSVIEISIILFLILDPFGNMVVINSLLRQFEPGQRTKIIIRESGIAAVILFLTALFGKEFFSLIGLEASSVALSGGIVLFLIALGMLFPSKRITDETTDNPPFIVPIAMPLIAGPSAISVIIIFSTQHSLTQLLLSIFLVIIASTLLLLLSSILVKLLGKRGSIAMERLMGMLLIMLSVQMILDGVYAYITAKS